MSIDDVEKQLNLRNDGSIYVVHALSYDIKEDLYTVEGIRIRRLSDGLEVNDFINKMRF